MHTAASPLESSRIGLALVLAAFHAPSAAGDAPVLNLTDDAIRKAVRETLAETPEKPPPRGVYTMRGDRYENFRQKVDDAVVPSCLHPDALKLQPAKIGPVGIGGIYALPFLAVAAIRGKCR